MNNIFKVSQAVLQSRNLNSVRYGTETISYIVPKIWSFPESIKNCNSLKSFKQKIRKWMSDCPLGYVKSICNMMVLSNN